MANKILVARGTKARLEEIKSSLTANELVYATDTKELGVKKTDGNIEYFMNATDINASKQDKLTAGDNITIDSNNKISASGIESYNDLTDKPDIPTKVSDLTNDTGYITGYTETDPIFTAWDKSTGISITKSQVSDLIAATQELSGLMSATDKQRLDALHALLEEDTENEVVDSINEILDIFQNYPEGADLVSALAGKVDKEEGKGLSTNDYTTTEKNKLAGIASGATNLTIGTTATTAKAGNWTPTWDQVSSKPIITVSGTTTGTDTNPKAVSESMLKQAILALSPAGARTPTAHNHDDRYYTETEVNTLLNGKAETSHTHSAATTSAAGFMSAEDKTHLDDLSSRIETKEDSANKVDNLNTPNNTTFGTTLAVKTYVDAVVFQKHDIVLIPDTEFTITQAYFNKTLIITSSSNVTITVPTQIVESIEKGFFCDIVRYGTGEVSFSGAGIVLNSAGPLSIDGQYIAASLIKIDNNNEWLLIGGRE